jgi:hypothetical protein
MVLHLLLYFSGSASQLYGDTIARGCSLSPWARPQPGGEISSKGYRREDIHWNVFFRSNWVSDASLLECQDPAFQLEPSQSHIHLTGDGIAIRMSTETAAMNRIAVYLDAL